MSDKKYQVFVSSTYTDLIDERKAVEETIIRAGDFPVGMEAFPATDDEQFEFIKTVIDSCDYYVLIVAGRYGTLASDGLSFTEKEFRYAQSIGVPILFLLRSDREQLPANKVEDTSKGKKKLDEFIEIASKDRIRKEWRTVDGLKLITREALDQAKRTKARHGWVRGDSLPSERLLQELAAVRRENDQLRERIGTDSSSLPMPELPPSTSEVFLEFRWSEGYGNRGRTKIKTTFEAMIAPFLASVADHRRSNWERNEEYYWVDADGVRTDFAKRLHGLEVSKWGLSEHSYAVLSAYLTEAGLIHNRPEDPVLSPIAMKFLRRVVIAGSGTRPDFEVVAGEFADLDEIPF